MTELTDLSETDASNTTVTTADIAEGCAPSGINNAIRNTLGLIRRAFKASIFRVRDTTDQTKLLAFDVSGVTTATTRTMTVPDLSGTLVTSGGGATTDNAIPRYDGTAGKQQASGVIIDDSNRVAVGLGAEATPGVAFLGDLNTGMWSPSADIIAWSTAGAENLRLSGMSLMLGTTTIVGLSDGTAANVGSYMGQGVLASQNNAGAALFLSKRSATGSLAEFYVTGAYVGGITVTGAATTFVTSSDYRLPWKAGHTALEGSGDFIDALNPRYFPEVGFGGFIAHEFAGVSPSSVHGEKDAVDGDGKPIYQGMDASTPEVMANIVAELQSLRRRMAEVEAK